MALTPGTCLGPYAITAQIGVGEMTLRQLTHKAVQTFPLRLGPCKRSASCAGRPWA